MSITTRTLRYPTGSESKPLDVYTPARPGGPCVLLWHGMGPDERDVLAPLAREIAGLGPTVLVPDWRADQPDEGRAHLTDTLRFVRDQARDFTDDSERIVLAGWSAGAGAALGVALHPELFDGWRPAAVVGIAGGYLRPARTTGVPPLHALDRAVAPVPVRLVHGTADTVIPWQSSRELHETLLAHGWDSQLSEPATDHAGVLGCTYDRATARCVPASDAPVRDLGRATARIVADVARSAGRG
ncbi:alpha/beta hydrolase [Streptomyces sp. NBC_01387]|uniref:alpha/beta hydrolase n=1 Tax=unclassified Streptomyces TaxID=2593676 RepID=UPI0020240976|nr:MULTISPECIES: alpha/beta hydrolase [unclassified Streptomyces]MCX4549871.1 alpha/beta hydrolase [Streptomyces sp. NBC_01500]WSC21394.1 alpha/beta hydrolase [Streptomyces sp. NBC_01766]WSV55324.1 alpha/beta hydrolase [Streptomyces sp. NBC_01014]